MDRWGIAKTAVTAIVVVSLVAVLLGSVFGQPVLLSYVTSESMEPTIETGDGFVAIPSAAAGSVGEGDIVVFQAEEIQGGGLTTHRIVEETDSGYITKGDGNPFTDQDSGEPRVKDEEIVAVAFQIEGEPVVIPGLGTVVGWIHTTVSTVQFHLSGLFGNAIPGGTQGLSYLIFALTSVLYVADVAMGSDRRRDRSRTRDDGISSRAVVGILAGMLVLAATASMVLPAGTHSYGLISSDFESDRPDVVQQGTTSSSPLTVGNGARVPVYVFFEEGSENVDIASETLRVDGSSKANTTISLTAPPETGSYQFYLTEHRYLAVLPESHVRTLYQIHSWLPVVVIDALIGIPFYILGVRLVGAGRVRSRSRDGPTAFDRLVGRFV